MPRYVEYMHELSDNIQSLERYDRWIERNRQVRSLVNQVAAPPSTPAWFRSIFGDNILLHNSIPRTELGMHSPSGVNYPEATTAGNYGRLNNVFVVHQDNSSVIDYFMVRPNLHLLDSPSTYVRTFFRHDDDNSYRVEAFCDSNSLWSIEGFRQNILTPNLGVYVSCLGCGIGGGLDIGN